MEINVAVAAIAKELVAVYDRWIVKQKQQSCAAASAKSNK